MRKVALEFADLCGTLDVVPAGFRCESRDLDYDVPLSVNAPEFENQWCRVGDACEVFAGLAEHPFVQSCKQFVCRSTGTLLADFITHTEHGSVRVLSLLEETQGFGSLATENLDRVLAVDEMPETSRYAKDWLQSCQSVFSSYLVPRSLHCGSRSQRT